MHALFSARADKSLAIGLALTDRRTMRISRNNLVIGDWLLGEAIAHLESGKLLPTDSFYDEESSEWLPLSELRAKQTVTKPAPRLAWPCYCGSGLPFTVCCGDGKDD